LQPLFLASGGQGPHGMGDLYAAQTVCVGFRSSPGEGACGVMTGYHENNSIVDASRFDSSNPCVNRLGRILRARQNCHLIVGA